MAEIKWLGWVDLETTGTNEKEDPILEIGFVLTDLEGKPKWSMARVVSPPVDDWSNRMNDTVRSIHSGSELIDDVVESERTLPSVEEELSLHLDQQGVRKHEIMLAGSGVGHFDKRFIDAQMPLLSKWFAYPVMDVGVIRRFLRFAGVGHLIPPLNESKSHRAMDDLNLHLAEYRHYLKLFKFWGSIGEITEEEGIYILTPRGLNDMETLLPGKVISQEIQP